MSGKGKKNKGAKRQAKAAPTGVLGNLPATRPARLGRAARESAKGSEAAHGEVASSDLVPEDPVPARAQKRATRTKSSAANPVARDERAAPEAVAPAAAKKRKPKAAAKRTAAEAAAPPKAKPKRTTPEPPAQLKAKPKRAPSAGSATRPKRAGKAAATPPPRRGAGSQAPPVESDVVVPIEDAPTRRSGNATRRPAARRAKKGPTPVRPATRDLDRGDGADSQDRIEPSSPPEPPRGTELVTTAFKAVGELAGIGVTLARPAVRRAIKRLSRS